VSCALVTEARGQKIALAARWLFDAYVGSNNLLSFVQIAVALEILLADKSFSDLMGIGEPLRNRCAYSISESHRERESMIRDFQKTYGSN
jgi:hypothetical protein